MNMIISDDGTTIINLDEIRILDGARVIFKGSDNIFEISDDAVRHLRETFRQAKTTSHPAKNPA